MFGKRSKQQPKQDTRREPAATGPAATPAAGEGEPAGESKPAASAPTAAAPVQPQAPARPDPSAVLNRQPTPPVNPDAGARPGAGGSTGTKSTAGAEEADNQLIVGQNIRMSGEIAACDKLMVEGDVEADLTETRELEVAPSGSFKGSAVVDVAEIAGHFDGDLVVRERLNLRKNGQVHGTIHYRALEIESGGRIGGTLVELSAEEAERYRGQPAAAAPESGDAAPAGEPEAPADEPAAPAALGETSRWPQDG